MPEGKFKRVDLEQHTKKLSKILGHDVDEQTYVRIMDMLRDSAYKGTRNRTEWTPSIIDRIRSAYRQITKSHEDE